MYIVCSQRSPICFNERIYFILKSRSQEHAKRNRRLYSFGPPCILFFFLHLILRFRFPILDKSKDKWAKKIFYPIIILLFDIYIHSTMFLNLMIDYYESWIYSIYISSAFEILMNERINYFLTEHWSPGCYSIHRCYHHGIPLCHAYIFFFFLHTVRFFFSVYYLL